METIAVIDLGEARDVVDQPTPLRVPRRSWVVLLVVLATLVLLGGAAPVRPGLLLLNRIHVAGSVRLGLGGGLLFIGEHDGAPSVSAYRLAGGGRRWQTRISSAPDGLDYYQPAGVVMVTSFDAGGDIPKLTVLDALTGVVLWRRAAFLRYGGSSGTAGLIVVPPPGAPGEASGEATETSWVDLRTGRVVWSRTTVDDTQFVTVGNIAVAGLPGAADPAELPNPTESAGSGSSGGVVPERLLMINSAETVRVLDENTGAVLGTRQLADPHPEDRPAGMAGTSQTAPNAVTVVGDRLYVQRRSRTLGQGRLTAYDLATLTPIWESGPGLSGYPVDCGPLLCLFGIDALTSLVAVDPASGAVRWRSQAWNSASMLSADRLFGYGSGNPATIGVLDAHTGRTLLDLPDWNVTVGTDLAAPLLTAIDHADPWQIWFAVLDPARPAVHPLGTVRNTSTQTCQASGGMLACQTTDGTVSVWRYGP